MAVQSVARVLNTRRDAEPFSYDWLNDLTWELARTNRFAEIRPAYTWGMVQAGALARALGCQKFSAIEFGVAGGRGLVALENIALAVEERCETRVEVYGFDTGKGLPKPESPRDLPNLYREGDYPMGSRTLRSRLSRANLLLGLVEETLGDFLAADPPPVGFVSVDVDLYTSTRSCLEVFTQASETILPRVHIYLDDILGLTFGDHNGERLAVREFNQANEVRKISPVYGLRHYLPWPLRNDPWTEMMFMLHAYDHPEYGVYDGLIPTTEAKLER